MNTYKILCEIDEEICFNIGGKSQIVESSALNDENNLNRIYRIQFRRLPKADYFKKALSAIQKNPNISLRFYGDYTEDKLDWENLSEIQHLQVDLWHTDNLKAIGRLKNLKTLGITKNISSKVSLSILEPLQNLETLYTSISKDIDVVGKLKKLNKISLSGIKNDDLNFLSSLDELRTLWISLGSYRNFTGIKDIPNLERLWIQQVRGFNDDTANNVLSQCKILWALKLDNLKHLTSLNFIKQMLKLKYLSMEGVKNLDTYNSILENRSLETIVGYNCQPGDKSLSGLIKLKDIMLGDTYNKSEINNFLDVSSADNVWIRGKQLKGSNDIARPFRI